ncbi:Lipoic acid synthetase [Bacillus thuringiensis serovar israelensis ATCC 35646]|nr:Lipoic acid synthetase [Bacillus thuringiensis serovar israelensis ATCC 35646]
MKQLDDLRANNVDILTLGQYLQPSKKHLPVIKYYPPAEFAELKEIALSKDLATVKLAHLCVLLTMRTSKYVLQKKKQQKLNNEKRELTISSLFVCTLKRYLDMLIKSFLILLWIIQL